MNIDMNDVTRDLVQRERTAIADLRALLGRLDAQTEDIEDLKIALDDLEGMFLLVVCGEFNSGKSSLVNAILGAKVMLEGVTPTTDRVTIVTYGDNPAEVQTSSSILRREYPAEILRDLAFVDTPGTNAVIKKHQELTEDFIPRADLVLFVTSADRPFTESERSFLELIGSWGKKIVIIINKVDILEDAEQRQKVMDFVRDNARETLGTTPQVFAVKARQALKARQANNTTELAGTGLPELESYIESTLAASERLRLKLLNPLGVAQRIATHYQGILEGHLDLLEDDRKTLEDVDRQLKQFEKDMRREFDNYLSRVKTVLLEVERRGEVFFDDTIRIRNVFSLMNTDRIKEDFESRVLRSADRDIDLAVSEMVDWFIQRNLQVWEDVMGFVNGRRKAGEERIIGEVGGRFQYDRDALIRTIRQSAEDVLETYDEKEEAHRLADKLQNAVVQTGLLQVSGIGLGAAVLAFVSGAALDITGVMAGLTIAGLGFFVLPRRRAQAKKELHNKMQELRDGLADGLGKQFDSELQRSSEKLAASIAPYTRFVRSELERLESLGGDLTELESELRSVRQEVEALH